MNVLKKKRYYFFILIGLLLISTGLYAQENYSWWNASQDWDGTTHWSSYMILSPDYMGPNALSVPFFEKGLVSDRPYIKMYSDFWFSTGDHTQDVGAHLYVPVVKKLIALEVWGVGLEHYSLTEEMAIRRRARHQQARGTASGDAYFAAVVSLIKDRKFPDLVFRFVLRTASGGKLSDARYTDAPGYFFDFSFGKNIPLGQKKENYLRGYGMLGFYSWQTSLILYRQDDAFLYGAGADFHLGNNLLTCSVAGYMGYLGSSKQVIVNPLQPVDFNDRPVVVRFAYAHEWEKWKLELQFQNGLHNFDYRSLRLSAFCFLPDLFHHNH